MTSTHRRLTALEAWLERHQAMMLWSATVADRADGARVEEYIPARLVAFVFPTSRRVALIHYFANGQGWEIYAPVTTEISINATLDAAARVLQLPTSTEAR